MATIYCKTESADKLGFYLEADGKSYFLCRQRYYGSTWRYFSCGVNVDQVFSKGGKHSYAVRALKLKLPACIEYVEREYGVSVLNKTIQKHDARAYSNKNGAYKRRPYRWREDEDAQVA